MLISIPYFALAYFSTVAIDHGWTEWLYLLVLLGIWNGLKFLTFGPWSLWLLLKVRTRERRTRTRERRTRTRPQAFLR
ncbi:hypothetical protein QDX23_07415 [Auritidibacter ignavus]|uniref:hypothetical protein n=1 Tax=Auritidibacter ignavus TaxID=678932 RepID=UPI0024482A7F|nr:hypothetical protein [Auritidibacter ignavus]WGH89966.1 hypothetical protein QDX23_07415 [Auritidibacter ignavus]